MFANLSGMSSASTRLLAAALVVISLGAPWVASSAECRAPGCITEAASRPSLGDVAAPGASPCACPDSCEAEPDGGDCAQICGRERETITGRQPQRIRREAADRASIAVAAGIGTTSLPLEGAPRWTVSEPFSPPSRSTPLFIRHRSIIR